MSFQSNRHSNSLCVKAMPLLVYLLGIKKYINEFIFKYILAWKPDILHLNWMISICWRKKEIQYYNIFRKSCNTKLVKYKFYKKKITI